MIGFLLSSGLHLFKSSCHNLFVMNQPIIPEQEIVNNVVLNDGCYV